MSELQGTPQTEAHTPETTQHPRASVQHRLGGNVLDVALLFTSAITLFLGWLIWSLVLWGQGQTPAKQILKMRVYSIDTGKPATWGHMAVRQFLIPMAYSALYIPFLIAALAVSVDSSDLATGSVTILGSVAVFALQLTDALWIFKGDERQRLTGLVRKIRFINNSRRCIGSREQIASVII